MMFHSVFLLLVVWMDQVEAWTPPLFSTSSSKPSSPTTTVNHDDDSVSSSIPSSRRDWLASTVTGASSLLLLGTTTTAAHAVEEENMFAPKFVQQYPDFTEKEGGWSYRDVTPGKASGNVATPGDRVVFDWSGYTIGYFGRPFQAKGGPQGGAFDKDLDYSRTVLGSNQMVKGLEEGLIGLSAGAVRQIVVPYGALSYPSTDPDHVQVGPKPSTFSGMRALNFVLENPRVDRTLLFNVKVIRVDKPDGKGGFVRG